MPFALTNILLRTGEDSHAARLLLRKKTLNFLMMEEAALEE